MNIVLRLFLSGLAAFIISLIVINIDIFSSFEHSNLYDAILAEITSMIFLYFIFKGMNDDDYIDIFRFAV